MIYRRALRLETEHRGLEFKGKIEDTDDESNYSDTSCKHPDGHPNQQANSQDPDSEVQQMREAYADTSLAFLKNIKTKGNI